jgi:ribonuclease P protein subunit RPR2
VGIPRRLRKKKAHQRKQRAIAAQSRLGTILAQPQLFEDILIKSVSRDIWRLSTRHQLGLPSEIKHWICRHCNTLIRPGVSARIRIRNGIRIITCECGKVRRFPLSRLNK